MHSNPAGYRLPVILAVGVHILVAAVFLVEWEPSHLARPIPVHMMARVVVTDEAASRAAEKASLLERQKQQADRRQQQAIKQEQARQEKAALKARQAKAERDKALKEKAIKEKAIKEKAAAKKVADEKKRREQEAQEQREAEQAAVEQAELEQKMLEQMAQESAEQELMAQREAERQAKVAARLETEYLARIRDQISASWVYPPGVDPEEEVGVQLVLVPTGQVIDVVILSSSGNQSLDRSVEQAILKASPLPVPEDSRVFEASFRRFKMKFRPENATW